MNTLIFFFQFQDILGLSVELMAQAMTSELLDGCQDDKSVKAGFVGEIGCCYPMNGLLNILQFFIKAVVYNFILNIH